MRYPKERSDKVIRERIAEIDDDSIYWLIKHVLYPISKQYNPDLKCIRSEQISRLNFGTTLVKQGDQGEIQGFIHFYYASDPAWIDMLAVHPYAREKGIGSELLMNAEMIALRNGARLISLYVDEQNKVGIQFYEKHGYFVDDYITMFKCYQMSKPVN